MNAYGLCLPYDLSGPSSNSGQKRLVNTLWGHDLNLGNHLTSRQGERPSHSPNRVLIQVDFSRHFALNGRGASSKGGDALNIREIPNYWSGHCFGCSRKNTHGLQLRFWRSEKGCFTRFSIPHHLCGFDGLAHGGIIATLLDEVAAWTIIARLGKFGLTREMVVRYLKPVPTDRELLIAGEIIDQDEKNVVLRSTIHAANSELLAEGESTFAFPSLSAITNITGVAESTLQAFIGKYARE